MALIKLGQVELNDDQLALIRWSQGKLGKATQAEAKNFVISAALARLFDIQSRKADEADLGHSTFTTE